MPAKVIVGMSGGVDSSVSALLLQQKGYAVHGLFMRNWEDEDGVCTSEQDYIDAQLVCSRLNIPLDIVNFSKEYMERVFKVCLLQLQCGQTPNPDILCNQEIKFKLFFDMAISMGADYIATGHYARIKQVSNQYLLTSAIDQQKDQTYFLHRLQQQQLAKVIFPLGEYHKQEVRQIANSYKLHNHQKKDSTGICFIGPKNFKQFIASFLLKKPGDIRDVSGILVGKHDGLMFYTLGQRSGLNIGGNKHFLEKPWYVVAKDLSKNTLLVSQDPKHPLIHKTKVHFKDYQWISNAPKSSAQLQAKIRYRQPANACTISLTGESGCATFTEPQFAPTPGQSIVIYDNDTCLGGAIISG